MKKLEWPLVLLLAMAIFFLLLTEQLDTERAQKLSEERTAVGTKIDRLAAKIVNPNTGLIDQVERLTRENEQLRMENKDLKTQMEDLGWWKGADR